MTDYHTKPLLGVRVDAGLQDWGRAEAKRRDQAFGDFIAGLLAAERERMSKPAASPLPLVAAEDEQPRQAGRKCTHPRVRVKGVCPDCPAGWVVKS